MTDIDRDNYNKYIGLMLVLVKLGLKRENATLNIDYFMRMGEYQFCDKWGKANE